MSGELVERLRGLGKWEVQRRPATATELLIEAADRIEALGAAIVQAREALEDCASGLRYIRLRYGELDGVGLERALKAANQALATLDST